VTDPRGHDTRLVVNQLNQTVRVVSREAIENSGVRYETDFFFDANGNLVRRDVQNRDEAGVLQPNPHITTTWEYEILNFPSRLRREVDQTREVVSEFEYDGNRNLVLSRQG